MNKLKKVIVALNSRFGVPSDEKDECSIFDLFSKVCSINTHLDKLSTLHTLKSPELWLLQEIRCSLLLCYLSHEC